MIKLNAKKINLMKLTAAVLSISLMLYVLAVNIRPERASAQTNTNEIRGIWVATVFGLDFPGNTSSSEKELKGKIDEVIKNCKNAGINTVFFQVRPASDAFYASDIFPWSKYLCGVQGKAPQNGFDPLKYAIEAAHKENISLHAWINPYRVTVSSGDENGLCESNPAKTHPEYVISHTDGKLYYNPGLPQVRELIISGALEIVKKYDVDGIHLDDYFYPDGDFDDKNAFSEYGNGKTLEDWRRDNVTQLIRDMGVSVHKEKKDVIFSVSPAGIWANKESLSAGSLTFGSETYFKGYADTRLWVKEELIDWIMPQIYWNKGYSLADFTILMNWWSDVVNGTSVKLCPGLAAYKASDTTDQSSPWYGENGINELKSQVEYCRMSKTCGYAFYRYGSVFSNNALLKMTEEINKTDTPAEIFTDINNFPWAKTAVTHLFNLGIVNGYSDKSFGGQNNVTRGDFTLMLIRASQKEVSFNENFSDVNQNDYYFKEIGTAKKLNIVSGYGDNMFLPKSNITRQDMAVIIYRYMLSEKLTDKGNAESLSFSDNSEISDYAKEAVAALSKLKIINGYEDGSFKPQNTASRAETAVMLYRMIKMAKK